jgi:hypothetical protein
MITFNIIVTWFVIFSLLFDLKKIRVNLLTLNIN